LKILHIWDQAGVACIIAKYQNKMGHEVKVMRTTNYDPYGIYEFYENLVCFTPMEEFLETCLREANVSDIVHIHSRIDVFFYLHNKISKKPRIVMHFHGTDLRGIKQSQKKWPLRNYLTASIKNYRRSLVRKRSNALVEKFADMILVSTPDLLSHVSTGSVLLHNPVDTEHFNENQNSGSNERAFTFATESKSVKNWIIRICKQNGINNLDVVDRTKKSIKYFAMPNFLRDFGIYIDILYINNKLIKSNSKTGLESLACGLRVIDYTSEPKIGLPVEHQPSNVVQKLEIIYQEIL
jgi:hypothetical protein